MFAFLAPCDLFRHVLHDVTVTVAVCAAVSASFVSCLICSSILQGCSSSLWHRATPGCISAPQHPHSVSSGLWSPYATTHPGCVFVIPHRVAVPACGIEQLLDVFLIQTSLSREQQVVSAAAAAATQFPAIHSDALAVLLGLVPLPDSVWQLFSQQVSVCPHWLA